MSDTTNVPVTPARETPWIRLGLRWLLALLLAIVSVWVVLTIYEPLSLLGGMLLDSCSGGGSLWEIWLRVLWAGVLLVSALAPPLLIALRRRWRWVLLSMVVGAGASVTWYLLWFVIATMACQS